MFMIDKLGNYKMGVCEFLRLSTSEFSDKKMEDKIYDTEIGKILIYGVDHIYNRLNPIEVWEWGQEPANEHTTAVRHRKIDWVVSIHNRGRKITKNIVCGQLAAAIAEISIRRSLKGRYSGDLRLNHGEYVNALAKILIEESDMPLYEVTGDLPKYLIGDTHVVGSSVVLTELANNYLTSAKEDIRRVPSNYDLYHKFIDFGDKSEVNYELISKAMNSFGKYWARCLAISLRMMDMYSIQKENFKPSFLDYLTKKAKSGSTYDEATLVEAFTCGNGISDWWIHDMEEQERKKEEQAAAEGQDETEKKKN